MKRITRLEAAEFAGVHLNTIRLWEEAGRLDAQKGDNGVVMVPRAQVAQIATARAESKLTDAERITVLEVKVRSKREEVERVRVQIDLLNEYYSRLLDAVIERLAADKEAARRKGGADKLALCVRFVSDRLFRVVRADPRIRRTPL